MYVAFMQHKKKQPNEDQDRKMYQKKYHDTFMVVAKKKKQITIHVVESELCSNERFV